MSRRNVCTKETVDKARKLKSNGLLDKDIAAILGVGTNTFSRWINHPKSENQRQLGEAIKASEANWRGALEQRIITASEKDWKAAAWMLERKDPMNYSLSPSRFEQQQSKEETSLDRAKKLLADVESVI